MPLTEFQVVTERALVEVLESRGRGLRDRELAGWSETYVTAKISGTPLEVYIYEDEAQVQGPAVDERFEVQDYPDAEALRRAFLLCAARLAEQEWPAAEPREGP